MKKRLKIMLILALVVVILSFLTYFFSIITKEGKVSECKEDSDCVPSSCCHSTSCTTIDKSPICEGILCTQVCLVPLDCGAGYCSCISGKCNVINKK